jgi:hypothetical protein
VTTWSNYTKALLDAAETCDKSAERWRASGLEERAVAAEELAACFRRRAAPTPKPVPDNPVKRDIGPLFGSRCEACGKTRPTEQDLREHRYSSPPHICWGRDPGCLAALKAAMDDAASTERR